MRDLDQGGHGGHGPPYGKFVILSAAKDLARFFATLRMTTQLRSV
jgi:hypothetical protein